MQEGALDQRRAVFEPFRRDAPMQIYRRHLPHWRQDGATYFVTFRLVDSIPRVVLEGWREDDRIWLRANGVLGPLTEYRWRKLYELVSEKQRRVFERRAARRLHVELDRCQGSCLLRQSAAAESVCQAMCHCDGREWSLGDMVVMPNHVHALVKPYVGAELESTLQRVKRFTATRIGKLGLKEPGALWQRENYDHIVRDRTELAAFRKYVAENPIKAGLRSNAFRLYRSDWLDA